MRIALLTDVFFDERAEERLAQSLQTAKAKGASLAVLPEIPLNPWSPATKTALASDAEAPDGPRVRMMARAARESGVGIVGGAILADPSDGKRHNTALVFDSSGELVGTHRKQHLPDEPGFWETSHYESCSKPIGVIDVDGVRVGVQVCSDINRPMGAHAQAALGAQIIINPRSTELASYEKWRHVFLATAWTSRTFVVSVNRPREEQGVLIGGPSIAVGPDMRVITETTSPCAVVELDLSLLDTMRSRYPGYLPVRSDLYADAWKKAEPVAGGCVPGPGPG